VRAVVRLATNRERHTVRPESIANQRFKGCLMPALNENTVWIQYLNYIYSKLLFAS